MNLRIGFDAAPPEEALAFWQTKVPVSRRVFDRLATEYQVRAFTVSKLAGLDQLTTVQASLEKALADGQDFATWKESLRDLFDRAGWTKKDAFRVDTIFRNNLQTAYNAGRWNQGTEAGAPYVRYNAIDDDRSRPTHRAQDGKVFPRDHDFWKTWYPPNGHRCRCSADFLTEEQVRELGLPVATDPGMAKPSPGFDVNPAQQTFRVDLSRYSPSLRRRFLEGAARQPVDVMQQYLEPEDFERMMAIKEEQA